MDATFQVRQGIAGDAEVNRLTPGLLDQRGEGDWIGCKDLIRTDLLARADEFVARGEDRHTRPAPNAQPRMAPCRRERKATRVEALARCEKAVLHPKIEPARTGELSWHGRLADCDRISGGFGVFLHYDSVSPRGKRRARKNPHRLADP